MESDKVCSNFDQDCYDVENPLLCWLGAPDGMETTMPMADGKCPLLGRRLKKKTKKKTPEPVTG